MTLTVGSLFSGIGGLDLGLERAGMEVIWQSEIDPYASKVLEKHWPKVPNYGDIKTINWGDVVRPDVICGGYPCQPFSTAGKRNGTDDPRHLWPWVREAISELQPKYAILENVRGHVSLGLSTVLGEMASIGYDAEWQIVSAASVGAPHLRERVIIVAYPSEQFSNERGHDDNSRALRQRQALQEPTRGSNSPSTNAFGALADTDGIGSLHGRSQIFTAKRWLNALGHTWAGGFNVANTKSIGLQSGGDMASIKDTQPRHGITGDNSGTQPGGSWWQIEPDVGRVAHGVPSRVDRLRGLGNAVVPQVAELIGRMVIDYDSH